MICRSRSFAVSTLTGSLVFRCLKAALFGLPLAVVVACAEVFDGISWRLVLVLFLCRLFTCFVSALL
ncbi:hypothetical protein NOF04DRAFT_1331221, partial [Fusarium oxysporum II5]